MIDKHASLKNRLLKFIPCERLIDDPLRTLAYATDASFYRLVPKLVVKLVDENEVSRLLYYANQLNVAVTFRAAGTSLSGQAISDSVLAMLEGNAWRDYKITPNGKFISLQPGIIGAQANAYLAPIQRKIGPDPASINAAKIGGIAANNASGMCCGVAQNSYQTLQSMRIVFSDGSVLDTASEESREAFGLSHGRLLEQLEKLATKTRSNHQLAERIRQKYKIKNTTGYSLNALVDYSNPFEILQHLLIGSEGTLGFISEITYKTVPDYPDKASALIFFQDIYTACQAVTRLKSAPVDAVELMDRASLRAVADKNPTLSTLPDTAAALLVETRADSRENLDQQISQILATLAKIETIGQPEFTAIAAEYSKFWEIRKGMFPSVGKIRTIGTTVIIEDIAFPIENLADATIDLQQLFEKHGYDEAIIFGHALEGNLHFVITQDFSTAAEIVRYHDFTQDVCELVVDKYDGSLKAEHSTGRNMAPFVEMEWGKEAYELMESIKDIFDPHHILNPGVILNNDPNIHIKNLKPMPVANDLIDRCIECGFCEPICPSRNLSLTPRQRIVILREMARLSALPKAQEQLQQMQQEFEWYGNATCAADGLCATKCPVGIDTGQMIKSLRSQQNSERSIKVANWVHQHMDSMTSATRMGLGSAHLVSKITGPGLIEKTTQGINKLTGGKVPVWHRHIPRAAKALKATQFSEHNQSSSFAAPGSSQSPSNSDKYVVYFPSCVSRSMGTASNDKESRDLTEVMLSLFEKAGFKVMIPQNVNQLCCGLPFSSKGLNDSADKSLSELESELWKLTQQGKLEVVCDTSPCTERMKKNFQHSITAYEPVEFIFKHLLPELELQHRVEKIALHITCSARKMALDKDFIALANQCAKQVIMPEEQGCCGFAGDKGFVIPELNHSALSRLKQQIPADCLEGYSNSRSCEIGLSKHSGIQYRSIAYLVDKCFIAKSA